jgi:nitroreductase
MILDLIKSTRSYRRFKGNAPITREQLVSYVEAARFSASAINAQRLRFALVSDVGTAEEMFGLVAFAGFLRPEQKAGAHQHPVAYIVICSEYPKDKVAIDIGIAAQSIVLAAREDGVGACMIGSYRPDGVSELLSLPEEMKPYLVIALGYPDERVELCDATPDNTRYFRDPDDVHMVPKLPLDYLIIK